MTRARLVMLVTAASLVTACQGRDSSPPTPVDTAAPTSTSSLVATSSTQSAGEVAPVALPWLRREGQFLVDETGRRFLVRGVDYAYNTVGLIEEAFDLTDDDLDRIRSWGMNTVRIRLRGYRAGMFPTVPAEPGYLEGLDRLITRINQRGMYVIVATGGPDDFLSLDNHPHDPLFDAAKYRPGNPAREHWLGYLEGIFARYREWPGVIGFDPINEDISYPPEVLDSLLLEDAHRDILAVLRAADDRHVYFQQPAGWAYQGESVAVGHDLGDDNRFFCVKWGVSPRARERFAEQQRWAADAGTPLFVCEYNLIDSPRFDTDQKLALQREVLSLLDGDLTGSIRLGYLPSILGSLIDQDRNEAFWVGELVRPQPSFVGGAPTSLVHDVDTRTLTLMWEGDGSGPTEVMIHPRLYPGGFTAASSSGERLEVPDMVVPEEGELSYHPQPGLIALTGSEGPITLTVEPLGDPEPPPVGSSTRPPLGPVPGPVPGSRSDPVEFTRRLVAGGQFDQATAVCIVDALRTTLPRSTFNQMMSFSQLSHEHAADIGRAVFSCVENQVRR